MAWVIRGAKDYLANGLREPESVMAATADYAHDQDTVARFVEEMCHRAPRQPVVKILVRDLWSAYDYWCNEAGETPVTAKRLTQDLQQRYDVVSARSHGKRFYNCITLLSDRDEDGQPTLASRDRDWFG